MKTKIILVSVLIMLQLSAFGQFTMNHTNFAEISGGYGYSMPIINNIKAELWKGFHYRERHIEINYYTTSMRFNPVAEVDTFGRSKSFMLGYMIPLKAFKLGNRSNTGTSGWLLQPALGGYAQFFNFAGNKTTTLGICPELHLQLPYSLIALKLNTGYNFTGKNSGDAIHTRGLVFYPQISIQFDALTTLHNITNLKTGVQRGSYSWDVVDKVEQGAQYTYIHYTRYSRSYAHDWFATVMDPFWAVNIRAEVGKKLPVNTYNFGLGLSGRRYLFMADTYLSYGKYYARGFNEVKKELQPKDLSPFDGYVNASGINLNLGLDAWFALKKFLFPGAHEKVDDGIASDFTPFKSIYMGMGLNYLIPGKTKFKNPALASQSINNFFTENPDIERSAMNDPSITKPGMGMNFFIQIEVASIGITFNANVQQKMGVNNTVGIIYHLPLKKNN